MTTKQVIPKKDEAGFEHLNPAGDDTPSHDRLTSCWGIWHAPEQVAAFVETSNGAPGSHPQKKGIFLKEEAIACLKKESIINRNKIRSPF